MRARDRERDQWFRLYNEQRVAFDEERSQWAKERATLLNTIVSQSSAEFVTRQRASTPMPVFEVPREERAPDPQPMGL